VAMALSLLLFTPSGYHLVSSFLIFQCFKSRCKISLLKYTTYNTSRAVAVRRGLRFHPVTD
jgi:hypothetical protein